MAQSKVQEFLSSQDPHVCATWDPDRDKAMVIVETRPTLWLPRVIHNAIQMIGWNLYVFGTQDVLDLVQGTVVGDYKTVVLPNPLTVQDYSALMMQAMFWLNMAEEHVLVFQSDCVFLRPIPEAMLVWDYIGAICGQADEQTFIMNGGLSLRRRSAMVRAIDLLTEADKQQPEDVAFTHVMRRHKTLFHIPFMRQCFDFAIETIGNPKTCVGIHGTDKGYADPRLIAQAIQHST